MGINGLCQFLRKIAPSIVVEVPVASFSGHRLAVDASVYLYKFICIDNQFKGQWLDMFIGLIVWLRKNNIRPLFVFDGTPPKQKERTQKERRANRHRIEQKVLELEDLLDALNTYNRNEPLTPDLQQRVDNAICTDTSTWSRVEVMREINERYKKENSKAIHIGPAQIKRVQDLLTYIGLPWFTATGEAEKTCSWLCKWEYVKGVITTDSDVLAYGVPIFIHDLRTNQETCKIIRHEDVLEVLDFTQEQFKDFCIMCGTDYNNRIPGYGPTKIYNLFCEHGNLDEIGQTTLDISTLYHHEGRELFTLPPKERPDLVIEGAPEDFRIPRVKSIAKEELALLLNLSNSRYLAEELEFYIYRPKFTINTF